GGVEGWIRSGRIATARLRRGFVWGGGWRGRGGGGRRGRDRRWPAATRAPPRWAWRARPPRRDRPGWPPAPRRPRGRRPRRDPRATTSRTRTWARAEALRRPPRDRARAGAAACRGRARRAPPALPAAARCPRSCARTSRRD